MMGEYGWFVNVLIYVQMFVSAFVKPVVLLFKGLRWLALRYPKQSAVLVMAIIAWMLFQGLFNYGLNPKIFGSILLVDLVAMSVCIAMSFPLGEDPHARDRA